MQWVNLLTQRKENLGKGYFALLLALLPIQVYLGRLETWRYEF